MSRDYSPRPAYPEAVLSEQPVFARDQSPKPGYPKPRGQAEQSGVSKDHSAGQGYARTSAPAEQSGVRSGMFRDHSPKPGYPRARELAEQKRLLGLQAVNLAQMKSLQKQQQQLVGRSRSHSPRRTPSSPSNAFMEPTTLSPKAKAKATAKAVSKAKATASPKASSPSKEAKPAPKLTARPRSTSPRREDPLASRSPLGHLTQVSPATLASLHVELVALRLSRRGAVLASQWSRPRPASRCACRGSLLCLPWPRLSRTRAWLPSCP